MSERKRKSRKTGDDKPLAIALESTPDFVWHYILDQLVYSRVCHTDWCHPLATACHISYVRTLKKFACVSRNFNRIISKYPPYQAITAMYWTMKTIPEDRFWRLTFSFVASLPKRKGKRESKRAWKDAMKREQAKKQIQILP